MKMFLIPENYYKYIVNFNNIYYGCFLIFMYLSIHFSDLLYLIISIHIFAIILPRKGTIWKTRYIFTSGIIQLYIYTITYINISDSRKGLLSVFMIMFCQFMIGAEGIIISENERLSKLKEMKDY